MKNLEDFKSLLSKTAAEVFFELNNEDTDDETRTMKKLQKKEQWLGKMEF